MKRSFLFQAVALALGLASSLEADPVVRRMGLVAGANDGGSGRVKLRYAIADADRFGAVMARLGGLPVEDTVSLKDPTRRAFLDGLDLLRVRAEQARKNGARVEAILYYSGHADEGGLRLGSETLSYRELREAVQGVSAEVGITVLDACASGVITRLKGGRPRAGFLTDEAMRMQGQAFLTSSSENEAAQESERLKGSFFTHALVSGLSGAADSSGDGRVTLTEAYQFAFQETLAQTTATQGGAQHPAFDIRMAGTGDVVMTEIRRGPSVLTLGPAFDGRFYLFDHNRRLVAELYKPAGRLAEVALEPGKHEVQYEQGRRLQAARLDILEGERRELRAQDLSESPRLPTRVRGAETEPWALAGRTRVEISSLGGGVSSYSGTSLSLGTSLVHWLGEDLALEGEILGTTRAGGSDEPASHPYTTRDRSLGLWAGGRWYLPLGQRLRPFLRAGLGPQATFKTDHSTDGSRRSYTEGEVSSWLGGGLDWQRGRRFGLTLRVGWELRSGQSGRATYGLALGWSFGRAHQRD